VGRRGRSQFGIGYSLRHTAQYVGDSSRRTSIGNPSTLPGSHRAVRKVEYNRWDAPHLGNAAGGCVRLFADRTGSVCVGSGLQASTLLPARRKAPLRHDGRPIGLAVGAVTAGGPMRALSGCPVDSSGSNRKSLRSCPGYLCRAAQSSGCLPPDGSPLPNLL